MTELHVPQIRETRLGFSYAYRDMLSKVRDTFAQFGDADGDARVFIDLFPHGSLAYHISNLLIAKYISILTGRRIVGLTSRQPLFIRTYWNWSDISDLAEAFGVQDIVFLDEPVPGADMLTPETKKGLSAGPEFFVEAVEREALGVRYYGFEDRVRRRYLLPELANTNIPETWLRSEYTHHRNMEMTFAALEPQAGDYFLCGHLEYDPYKYIALDVIRNGGSTLYNWALQPFTLKKFDTEEDLMTLAPPAARDHFEETFSRLSKSPSSFDVLSNLYRASLRRVRPTTIGDRSIGGADNASSRRGVVLMTQAISDAVHSYGPMLFDDFADWVESSVGFLTSKDLDVCLRDHPMQPLYDQTDFVGGLNERYKNKLAFRLSPGAEVLDLTPFRMAVTTQGTPGIELPLDNIRVVITGRARYSGYGFVDEPQSRDEYFALLANETPLSDAELRRRFERAALFGYMELFSFRTTSRLLPLGLKGQAQEIIETLSSTVSLESVFSDPLYAQVSRLVLNDQNVSFNADSILAFDGALSENVDLGRSFAAEEQTDWWRAPKTRTAARNGVDAADKPRAVSQIASALKAAKKQSDDLAFATSVYRAFFGMEPEQAWLNGAFKCLGRPWGRRRLIHHTYNRWNETYRMQIPWRQIQSQV